MPYLAGITLTSHQGVLFIPFSRLGFWTGLLATLTVTALVGDCSMLADVGWSAFW